MPEFDSLEAWKDELDTAKHEAYQLGNDLADSEAKLRRCSEERTQSAAYAVTLEDRIVGLNGERIKLIEGLQHLYDHLLGRLPNFDMEKCPDIHATLKGYVR